MRLGNIDIAGAPRVALLLGEECIDLTAQFGPAVDDVVKLWSLSDDPLTLIERCRSAAPRITLSQVTLRAPVLKPGKILGIGMNYHAFVAAARQLGLPIPPEPLWFLRPATCITGPHNSVWVPREEENLDYEVELAIVIGRRCRDVPAASATDVIAGFTIANDMTLRKRVPKSLVLAKAFDTHTPLGPCLVTPDELGDPHNLGVRTWVNGQLRQTGNTTDMILNCYQLIAQLSAAFTLHPGDVILTGTPNGSAIFGKPPQFLTVGDVVKLEIDGIGSIENTVVAEASKPDRRSIAALPIRRRLRKI